MPGLKFLHSGNREAFARLRATLSQQMLQRVFPFIPQALQKHLPVLPLLHPLTSLMQGVFTRKDRGIFAPDEQQLLYELATSGRYLILQEHEPILRDFFLHMQHAETPLGRLYRTLGYEDFLTRLITKRFRAIYADGRLIVPRLHEAGFILAYDSMVERYRYARRFLQAIGSAEDEVLYPEYLSLEEAAVSPFIVPGAHFLPLSDGRRGQYAPVLRALGLQYGNLVHEWNNAHPWPVAVSYLAAPEFRDGLSLQYDVLACVRLVGPREGIGRMHVMRQQQALRQPGFAAVMIAIYGTENALLLDNHAETLSFTSPLGQGLFYVEAYRHRLRHNLRQLFIIANEYMAEPGVVTVKGMSLGAFAIRELQEPMEQIFMALVKEVLRELDIPKIAKVNVVNLPSFIKRYPDPLVRQYVLAEGDGGLDLQDEVETVFGQRIPIFVGIEMPLARQDRMFFATHVCGDGLSLPGNEGGVFDGLRISSDDAAMRYSGFFMHKSASRGVDNVQIITQEPLDTGRITPGMV